MNTHRLPANIRVRSCTKACTRVCLMIAAGMSLLGPVSSWADEPAGNSIAMTPDGLASQDQHQQEAAYEPTRIVLRDASFGFNFIALLPRQEKKQADPPRIVALLDKPWTAVGEGRLDESRGGFDAGGLVLSFGIERAVYVDGNLVTTTSFNVSDVGKITSDQMKTLSAQAAAMGLVQNGPGNTFQLTSGAASLPGTVIQNTLNNQSIKTLTIINATSNSLNLIKGINTLNTLSNVINSSINGH